MLRPRIAVCDVAPPTSVMNDAKWCSLKAMTSAGDRSCATTIRFSSLMPLRGVSAASGRHGWPAPLMTRSTTCRDVLPALTQIGVLEFVELRDQLLHLLHQRPFGIAAALADQRLRYLAQLGIVEDHAVQVEEGTELGRCMLGTFLHGRQLALHLLERGLEAATSLSTIRGAMVRWATSSVACEIRWAVPMAMPPETPGRAG